MLLPQTYITITTPDGKNLEIESFDRAAPRRKEERADAILLANGIVKIENNIFE